ncbi:hypothetical protein FGO68_gene12389 [Halteria grandinella]|uniref:Uncharacterized protein n=1 Tax=Halteria grandinella TaxID=5974 RepID=A0A8J8P8B6_HALGN|nr:hypothetical protein FGO68_gene12389 [Halteria grandinella]
MQGDIGHGNSGKWGLHMHSLGAESCFEAWQLPHTPSLHPILADCVELIHHAIFYTGYVYFQGRDLLWNYPARLADRQHISHSGAQHHEGQVHIPCNLNVAGTITQSSGYTGVVGALTQATVKFTITTGIPAGATLQMKFSKLNKDAPTSQQKAMILATSLKCNRNPAYSQVSSPLDCTFSPATDTLTIPTLVTSPQPPGTELSLLLDGIYNPYNFTALQVSLRTMTGEGGVIDERVVGFAASEGTEVAASTAKVSTSDDTVQEYASYNIEFVNPIPLSVGTLFTLVFPSDDYGTFDSRLTTVQGFGLFGSLRTLKYVSDSSQRSPGWRLRQDHNPAHLKSLNYQKDSELQIIHPRFKRRNSCLYNFRPLFHTYSRNNQRAYSHSFRFLCESIQRHNACNSVKAQALSSKQQHYLC